jgi:hypothetical protein
MIVLRSSLVVRSSSYRPCYSPSPWGEGRGEGELNLRERSERNFLRCSGVGGGSGERGERRFLCCSFVGELCFRERQSALIKVGQAYSRAVLKFFSVSRHTWPVSLWQKSDGGCPKSPSLPKATQPFPRCSKASQAIPNLFPGKKDCLFFISADLGLLRFTRLLGATQPKSTPASQKAEQKPTNADQKHESYR